MCERDVFGREALVCRQALHGDEYTGETLLTERRGRGVFDRKTRA